MKIITIRKIKSKTILCCLISVFPFYVSAETYFDPALLMNGTGLDSSMIDLNQYEQGNSISAGTYNMAVFINNRFLGERDVRFTDGQDQKIDPAFTVRELNEMGVNTDAIPAFRNLPADQIISPVSDYIPDAFVTFNLQKLSVNISVPQIAMQSSGFDILKSGDLDEGITALVLNYFINYSRTSASEKKSLSSSDNQMFFSSVNGGVNLGAWRLRSNYVYNNARNQSGTSSSSDFSGTHLYRSIISLKSTLRLGEISTASDIFESIPMKGITLTSNNQMQPDNRRGFAPVVTGTANSNATVTVRQNGMVVYQTFVSPGEFRIDDIPSGNMSGDMEVTIEEDNGSTRVFTQAYSSLPTMLRPGMYNYEVSAGEYDGHLTEGSRRQKFILGTFSYGLPENVTLYGGTLLANDYRAVSGGAGVSLGMAGAVSVDGTHSRATIADTDYTGESYRIRYSKSMLSTGTSFDLTAMRYSTKDYYSFSDFNNAGYALKDDLAPWLTARARYSFHTSITQSLKEYGTVSFRATKNTYWNEQKSNTNLAVSYNTNIKGVNYDLSYNIDRMKTDNNEWPENRWVALNISVPFSLFTNNTVSRSMVATYGMTRNNQNETTQQLGITDSAFDNKLSYGLYQNLNSAGNQYNASANASYNSDIATVSGGYSYSQDSQSLSANLSGGLVAHSDGITLSRQLGNTIAVISADGAATTQLNSYSSFDRFGNAVAGHLNGFNANHINVNVDTLPENVTFKETSMTVYPTEGAVIKRRFNTKIGYQALLTITKDGKLPPFGAIARLNNTDDEINTGIMGNHQQLYMSGLPDSGELFIQWGQDNQQCTVKFSGIGKIEITPQSPIRMLNVPCL
ncbi:fimbria/pilus outer membrane usher protein [Morganella morganii]|uniref:fimbria/pilus outer membrane usher protein n=1 Tax=Morganella morganii TaxID=582 RepID=UPI0034E4F17D